MFTSAAPSHPFCVDQVSRIEYIMYIKIRRLICDARNAIGSQSLSLSLSMCSAFIYCGFTTASTWSKKLFHGIGFFFRAHENEFFTIYLDSFLPIYLLDFLSSSFSVRLNADVAKRELSLARRWQHGIEKSQQPRRRCQTHGNKYHSNRFGFSNLRSCDEKLWDRFASVSVAVILTWQFDWVKIYLFLDYATVCSEYTEFIVSRFTISSRLVRIIYPNLQPSSWMCAYMDCRLRSHRKNERRTTKENNSALRLICFDWNLLESASAVYWINKCFIDRNCLLDK